MLAGLYKSRSNVKQVCFFSYQLEVSRVKQNLNDVQSSKELQNRKVTQLAQKNVDLVSFMSSTRYVVVETSVCDRNRRERYWKRPLPTQRNK